MKRWIVQHDEHTVYSGPYLLAELMYCWWLLRYGFVSMYYEESEA